MLQEYWASTVIFIGIFSQCISFYNSFVVRTVQLQHSENTEILCNFVLQSSRYGSLDYFRKRSRKKLYKFFRNPKNYRKKFCSLFDFDFLDLDFGFIEIFYST